MKITIKTEFHKQLMSVKLRHVTLERTVNVLLFQANVTWWCTDFWGLKVLQCSNESNSKCCTLQIPDCLLD